MNKPIFPGLAIAAAGLVMSPEVFSAKLFSRGESFSYSGAVPATSYVNMLIGPAPESGNHALSRNRIEFGLQSGAYQFSVFHRNDYNLDFATGTAMFAWLNKNRQAIPLGQEYQVDVWANQYQLSGIKLARQWSLSPSIDFTFGISYFAATEGIYGYLGKNPDGEGGVVALEDREILGQTKRILAGDLYTDYFYTDDVLFEREAEAPTGQGYTVDIGAQWRITERLTLSVAMEDVVGKIYWSDMPHTIAQATSETIVVDEDGFLEAHPIFSGSETYDDFEQPLRSRERVNLSYQWNKFNFGYEYDRFEVVDFNRLAVGYNWSERWGAKVAREMQTQAWHLGLKMPVGQVSVVFDDLNFDKAHTIGFAWTLGTPF